MMRMVKGERRCGVCGHSSAGVINKQLIEAKHSYRQLELEHSIGRTALNLHYRLCLLPKILSGGDIYGL
jgi:hypothetical protein